MDGLWCGLCDGAGILFSDINTPTYCPKCVGTGKEPDCIATIPEDSEETKAFEEYYNGLKRWHAMHPPALLTKIDSIQKDVTFWKNKGLLDEYLAEKLEEHLKGLRDLLKG